MSKAYGQTEPRYTHYMFNTLSFNPAYAGSKQAICASLLYHNQWMGHSDWIDDGASAPLTETFNIQGLTPLGSKKGSTAGQLGLGLSIINDKIGWVNSTGAMLDLAYRFEHLPGLSFAQYLSFGLGIGLMEQSISPQYKAKDQNDPWIPGSSSSTVPDGNIGVYLGTGDLWYGGISVTHFFNTKTTWQKQVGGTMQDTIHRALYLDGGYRIHMNADFDLLTSAQIETDFTKKQISLSGLALYHQMVYGGLTIRNEKLDPVAIMAGFYPKIKGNGQLMIGASYDIPTAHSGPFGGSPEIFARYCFNLTIRTIEPVFMKDGRHL
jgi:type IX secretion system PorP/SprF family membrane protein